MAEAPYTIIRHREGMTLKRSIRIIRCWKSKETGNVVEVRSVKYVVGEDYLRVVFFDPEIRKELSLPMKRRPNPFQPPGAMQTVMEPGFEDLYEPYGNFSSRV